MDKKEIQTRLNKAKYIHAEVTELIADLGRQLEKPEPEKPKLRHGVGGINEGEVFIVMEQSSLYGTPKAFYADQGGQVEANENMPNAEILIPNIFDDLAALSGEPLERWESDFKGYDGKTFRIENDKSGYIWIGVDGQASWYKIEDAEIISLKLRQAIHTAKQKAK